MQLIQLALPLAFVATLISAGPLPDSKGLSFEPHDMIAREPYDNFSTEKTFKGVEQPFPLLKVMPIFSSLSSLYRGQSCLESS